MLSTPTTMASMETNPHHIGQNNNYRIAIGRVFLEDHIARDLPTPVISRYTKTTADIYVEPGTEGWDDLLDDARHYASEFKGDLDYDYLARAAQRVVAKMVAAERRVLGTN